MTSKTLALLDTIRKSRIKGVSRREADQIASKHQVDSLIAQGVLLQVEILAKPTPHRHGVATRLTLVKLGPTPYLKQGVKAEVGLRARVQKISKQASEYFSNLT